MAVGTTYLTQVNSYNASKAATISLTEQLAVELKNPGLEVRVNTIAPGYFPSGQCLL